MKGRSATLYTSGTPEEDRKKQKTSRQLLRHRALSQVRRTALTYLLVSLLCIVFPEIYDLFGHGVRSAAMDLMFLFPLLGGAVPFTVRWLWLKPNRPVNRLAFNAYNSGIATLTTGRLLTGVFTIAGTTSNLLDLFWLLGGLEIVFALAVILISSPKSHVQSLQQHPRSQRGK